MNPKNWKPNLENQYLNLNYKFNYKFSCNKPVKIILKWIPNIPLLLTMQLHSMW